MSEQPWSKLYRSLTVELAMIYAEFYRTVILNKGTLTDVSDKLTKIGITRNPSAIKRLMKELNAAAKETSDTDLFIKITSEPYKSDDFYAQHLFAMCEGTERSARNWKVETDAALSKPAINVGAIGFSLPYLEYLRRQIPSAHPHKYSFRFNIDNYRTRHIPNILLKDPSLHFAIGENSHHDLLEQSQTLKNSGFSDELESKVLGEEELFLISNHNFDDDKYIVDKESYILKERLENFRYITSEKSILQYYIGLETGVINKEFDRFNEDLIIHLKNSGIQIRDQVEETIASMIDAFFLSRNKCAIIGGENLLYQMRARLVYLGHFYSKERKRKLREIHTARIEGRPFMQRRLYRRKNDAFSQSEISIQTGIWKAAMEIDRGIHTNSKKLSHMRIHIK